ncbi:MAG: hypothetical protein GX996_05780 [Firmicutes bacterium]|nr:hypothetical protein [Bacillota bacterium]
MAVAGVILVGFLIIYFNAPQIYQKKHYKDLIIFLVLTVLGLVLSILMLLDVPIGSPTMYIKKISNYIWKVSTNISSFFTR